MLPSVCSMHRLSLALPPSQFCFRYRRRKIVKKHSPLIRRHLRVSNQCKHPAETRAIARPSAHSEVYFDAFHTPKTPGPRTPYVSNQVENASLRDFMMMG